MAEDGRTTRGDIVFLAGPPLGHTLTLDDDSLTVKELNDSFKRFLHIPVYPSSQPTLHSSLAHSWPKWRLVDISHAPVTKRITKGDDAQFLHSFDQTKGSSQRKESLAHFLEELLSGLHGRESTAESSLLDPSVTATIRNGDNDEQTTTNLSFATTSTSFFSSTSNDTSFSPSLSAINVLPSHLKAQPLSTIPSATYIDNLRPATQTINLFVGVIKIEPIRTVITRRRPQTRNNPTNNHNTEREILELVVGDETKAGFSITFWLTPLPASTTASTRKGSKLNDNRDDKTHDSTLRAQVSKLRSGDLVCLTNIALSTWRGCVYGQSLSRRFARNDTQVIVLKRGGASLIELASGNGANGTGDEAGFWRRLNQVCEWTEKFLSAGENRSMGKKRGRSSVSEEMNGNGKKVFHMETLPPETQHGEFPGE